MERYLTGLTKDTEITIREGDRLREYFDSQTIVSGTTDYSLFEDPSSSPDAQRNFTQMPLQGLKDRLITNLALEYHPGILRSETDIDPIAICNALTYGAIQISVDTGDTRLTHERITRFVYATNPSVDHFNDSGSLTSEYTAELKSRGLVDLQHQIGVQAQSDWDLDVYYNSASALPTSAQWSSGSHGLGDLYLRGRMQVVEGPNLIDRLQAQVRRQETRIQQMLA
jgi:hypothetical protein